MDIERGKAREAERVGGSMTMEQMSSAMMQAGQGAALNKLGAAADPASASGRHFMSLLDAASEKDRAHPRPGMTGQPNGSRLN